MRSLKAEEMTKVCGLGCDLDSNKYDYSESFVNNLVDSCKTGVVAGAAFAALFAPVLVVYRLSRYL